MSTDLFQLARFWLCTREDIPVTTCIIVCNSVALVSEEKFEKAEQICIYKLKVMSFSMIVLQSIFKTRFPSLF